MAHWAEASGSRLGLSNKAKTTNMLKVGRMDQREVVGLRSMVVIGKVTIVRRGKVGDTSWLKAPMLPA